ncbi:MAG: hypothetical protein ABI411_08165 [Tahibacter sp.]
MLTLRGDLHGAGAMKAALAAPGRHSKRFAGNRATLVHVASATRVLSEIAFVRGHILIARMAFAIARAGRVYPLARVTA